ncbi:MAG: HemK2/MTQ2 family protein methyltransferase [Candidatus Hermodarchaeota archaeon]
MRKIKFFPDPIIEYDFKNVYRPSDDTYLVVDYFKYHLNSDFFDGIPLESIRNILDMGTGTGYIALSLQIMKTAIPKFNPNIYASDILEESIKLSKHNEKLNNFENQIHFIHSDLFDSFPKPLKHCFNIIIFNPPYLPSIKLEKKEFDSSIDYSWDGGSEGFEVFLNFLDQAKEFLKLNSKSYLYYLCSSRTNLKKLYHLIKNKGYKNKILEKRHVFMEDIFLNKLEFVSS